MRARPLLVGLLLGAFLVGHNGHRSLAAQDAAEQARRAAVVARVGPKMVTAGELEDRLAAVPRFQLVGFGDSPDAIRRKFLNDVIIAEVLMAAGAEDLHLDRELPTAHQVDRVRSSATLRALRTQLGSAATVPVEDVKKYYELNKSRYDSPERLGVWRILCRSREEAVAVIEAARKDSTPLKFQELARDHSLDKATNLRGGNLGFLAPDGTSNEAGLKADPAIVKAAATVKDGEIVAAPVPEGAYFAAVWRRGTVGASKRSVEDVAAQIRDTLWKQRVEEGTKKLIEELRARELTEYNEQLVNGIEISPEEGNVIARRRPGQVTPLAPTPGKPPPK